MLFDQNTGSGFPEPRWLSEKPRDASSCSFFTNERPRAFIRIYIHGWDQRSWLGSRPITKASLSLSLSSLSPWRPDFATPARFSLIFLICLGWVSFLSRPTTFLRDQNRGAPLFASAREPKGPRSFLPLSQPPSQHFTLILLRWILAFFVYAFFQS